MIQTDKYGIYHVTNEGYCCWYEFAKEIIRLDGWDCEVTEISSADYETKAKRPLNSCLSKENLQYNGFEPLRYWKEALNDYLT